MTAPNLATITASLERSLQNCSLNRTAVKRSGAAAGFGRSSSSDSPGNLSVSDATLDLHSDASLPYHWQQCLDLKSGEIYYLNWATGDRVKEDPRTAAAEGHYEDGGDDEDGGYYSEEEEEEEEEEESSSCESEESSSESSPEASSSTITTTSKGHYQKDQTVLVVAGCKSCLMYYMVPKQVLECPKCCGQLLHFDRSETGSP